MTAKEAQITISAIKFMLDNAQYSDDVEEALDMSFEALELEQRILDNGYSGEEAEFRIGGRLFGIREKAQ